MKRILLLGDINSSHLIKWAVSLKKHGAEVGVFSLSKPANDWYTVEKIRAFIGQENVSSDFKTNDSFKLRYISALGNLKKSIQSFNPDIVHAHYASSYGLLGALSGFKNFNISVWGSDVFSFPRKSIFHRLLLKYNLSKARIIFSASEIMADEAAKYTQTPVHVIPFGVDTDKFHPLNDSPLNERKILIIGAVKSLEPIYAIDILIKAFASVSSAQGHQNLRLLIVGDGSLRNSLENLSKELGLANVDFVGKVDPFSIPDYHRSIDIFVNVSLMESFGVSVLEAMSCGKPVIVSKVGGLVEITDANCAVQVNSGSIEEVENALNKLIAHPDLRAEMGKKGRRRVEEKYDWNDSVEKMMSLYNRMM